MTSNRERRGSAFSLAHLIEMVAPARAAAEMEREKTLAKLSHVVGRNVELNEHGGVTLTDDEIATLKLTIPSGAPTPTSAWGIPIHAG